MVAVSATVAVALVAARPWTSGNAALAWWWPQGTVLTAVAVSTLLLPLSLTLQRPSRR